MIKVLIVYTVTATNMHTYIYILKYIYVNSKIVNYLDVSDFLEKAPFFCRIADQDQSALNLLHRRYYV